MGSFNSSCFLSNQNIYVNDQIVCLILINNPHPPKNYFNYIGDLYLNLFLPITGYTMIMASSKHLPPKKKN